jgi:hypothetical protein
VRAGISAFASLAHKELAAGLEGLAADLGTGAWDRRHGDLRSLSQLDVGYRLIVCDF